MGHHIYLFRHGETFYNKSKRFTGCINSRLTNEGKNQAKLIAYNLRDKKFDVAFKTSLSRSSDSLKIILQYHPECKRIVVDDRLIERSYGDLEGKYHKTIIKDYGRKQFDVWHRSYDVPPPGGESLKMVEKRVVSFIKDLPSLIEKEKGNAVISAHNNSMRPFRRYFENLTITEMMALENPFDKYFHYRIRS
jgi:2,3-bisphosphoglycerate-dependent phosphoglycerate mutase